MRPTKLTPNKDYRIDVRLTKSQFIRLNYLSSYYNSSVSDLLRSLIDSYISANLNNIITQESEEITE